MSKARPLDLAFLTTIRIIDFAVGNPGGARREVLDDGGWAGDEPDLRRGVEQPLAALRPVVGRSGERRRILPGLA